MKTAKNAKKNTRKGRKAGLLRLVLYRKMKTAKNAKKNTRKGRKAGLLRLVPYKTSLCDLCEKR